MPVQTPQWTDFLSCPICYNEFECNLRRPVSLGCGHTMCKSCLSKLQRKQCPFDQTAINYGINELPENYALLQLVGGTVPDIEPVIPHLSNDDLQDYACASKCIRELALYLKYFPVMCSQSNSALSRPMQRKIVTLINCQLVEDEGRTRGMRAARSLGERSVMELILHHQNSQQLSANLWAAVRARGCQFLGPAMQEEVLKLVLLALEDGSPLSRKVLVMFVVQRLAPHFPQASKTSIGHVVQLLYRASCFKVSKREGDSSLMQLKEEFRTYEALRREHDAQIVAIATEAGLRIAPDQWSSLLYGDTAHKSHMQSVIDKLQTPQSFAQSIQELIIALQRTGDPGNLSVLRPHLELLANIDPSPDVQPPQWKQFKCAQEAAMCVVKGLVEFIQSFGNHKRQEECQNLNAKYKTSMCRDLAQRGSCPRGLNCTFAHSQEELEKFRSKNKRHSMHNISSTCNNLNQDSDDSSLASSAVGIISSLKIESDSGKLSNSNPILSSDKILSPSSNCLISSDCFSASYGSTTASVVAHSIPSCIPKPAYLQQHEGSSQYGLVTSSFQPFRNLPSTQAMEKSSDVDYLKKTKLQDEFETENPDEHYLNPSTSKLAESSFQQGSETGEGDFYSPWTPTSHFPSTHSSTNSRDEIAFISSAGYFTGFCGDNKTRSPSFSSHLFWPSEKDEFIPFDKPLVSKYGPISRFSRSIGIPQMAMQVNSLCRMGEHTHPTSAVSHPLPSTSHTPSIFASNASEIQLSQFSENIEFADDLLVTGLPHAEAAHDDLSDPLHYTGQFATVMSDTIPLFRQSYPNEKHFVDMERKYAMKIDGKPFWHGGRSKTKKSLPTSIGPWPTQTLEFRSQAISSFRPDVCDEEGNDAGPVEEK